MNTDVRNEALSVIGELCAMAPDVRLGQLFAHLGFLGEDESHRTLGDIDDDELLRAARRHKAELVARLPASVSECRPSPPVDSVTPPVQLSRGAKQA
jgi:hypothetical protein